MYSVKEIAIMLDISTKQVYRYIEYMKKENINGFVISSDSDTGVTTVNDTGLEYIKERRRSVSRPSSRPSPVRKADDELVNFLFAELRAKDEQIAHLLKQAENYQLLLGHNGVTPFISEHIEEPPKKHHWWNRKEKS